MYICINCGAETKELYRRYCPSVLKVLKCEICGSLADKYIEYDPVIVFVDLILIKKQAYRHLLYNSHFKSYWKLMVILWLADTFRTWADCDLNITQSEIAEVDLIENDIFYGSCNFYILLLHTALSLSAFVITIVIITELRLLIISDKPHKYSATNLIRALTVGGCVKLLGLLGIVWRHVATDPYYVLIQGYTTLCLLTAYSVVCKSGKSGSLIGLFGGFLAHHYVSNSVSILPLTASNITLK